MQAQANASNIAAEALVSALNVSGTIQPPCIYLHTHTM